MNLVVSLGSYKIKPLEITDLHGVKAMEKINILFEDLQKQLIKKNDNIELNILDMKNRDLTRKKKKEDLKK